MSSYDACSVTESTIKTYDGEGWEKTITFYAGQNA